MPIFLLDHRALRVTGLGLGYKSEAGFLEGIAFEE